MVVAEVGAAAEVAVAAGDLRWEPSAAVVGDPQEETPAPTFGATAAGCCAAECESTVDGQHRAAQYWFAAKCRIAASGWWKF